MRKRNYGIRAAALLAAVLTFAVPLFSGASSLMREKPLEAQAAIEDVEVQLVGATAFAEARRIANVGDEEEMAKFVYSTSRIVTATKWQNWGILIGSKDYLSGSAYGSFQSPVSISDSEVAGWSSYPQYGGSDLEKGYEKYKAFGQGVRNLMEQAKKSKSAVSSVEEGLDSMSVASLKLANFGVEFLHMYNPGPVLISLYDSGQLANYPDNKLVQIVQGNEVLREIVHLFGDKVPGTSFSFFVILNAVLAIVGFGLWQIFVLLGNRTIGDGVKKFLARVVIGTVGVYLVSNALSVGMNWLTNMTDTVTTTPDVQYVEENLNLYGWYQTGFHIPADGTELIIDSSGNFVFTPDAVRAINYDVYEQLTGNTATPEAVKAFMEDSETMANAQVAFFNQIQEESGNRLDKYYALMKNYSENKEDLLDTGNDPENPLNGLSHTYVPEISVYMTENSLTMTSNGSGGWSVKGSGNGKDFGMNPISAFNLVRTQFLDNSVSVEQNTYPIVSCTAYNVVYADYADGSMQGASTNMNAITRFIACFTLVLAAFRGIFSIITTGFGGIISGGVKMSVGSAQGLGQGIGAVIALIGGILGISLIMSMTISLLDVVYGIARDLLGDTEVLNSFLQPIQDAVGGIPIIGDAIMGVCRTIADAIITLVLALTFPKLGGIPITMFSQFISDIPGRMAERAQMIENQLMSGRGAGMGGMGMPPGGHGGRYGQMASGMASQAMNQSMRQTGAIGSLAIAGVGAIGAFGITAAGKGFGKLADKLEGKPKNPGIDGWDDLSPEQQSFAALAAADNENWNDMDQDAREQYLADQGLYDEGGIATGELPEDGAPEGDMDEGSMADMSMADASESGADVSEGGVDASDVEALEAEGIGGDMAPVEALGAESSISETSGVEAMPSEGSAFESIGAAASDGESAGTGRSVSETSGGGTASGPSVSGSTQSGASTPGAAETDGRSVSGGEAGGNTQNIQEGSQSNVSVDQKLSMENKAQNQVSSEDRFSNIQEGGLELGGSREPGKTGVATPGAESLAGKVPAPGREGVQAGGGSLSGREHAQAPGTAREGGDRNLSIQNSSNQEGNQTTRVGIQSQTSARSSMTGGSTANVTKNTDASRSTSQRSTSTTKSPYGKEMSTGRQKAVRALRAAGHGMQVAGGNTTARQAVKEAMGHAKDAALIYATPVELQQDNSMQNIRMRRIERANRAKQARNVSQQKPAPKSKDKGGEKK